MSVLPESFWEDKVPGFLVTVYCKLVLPAAPLYYPGFLETLLLPILCVLCLLCLASPAGSPTCSYWGRFTGALP